MLRRLVALVTALPLLVTFVHGGAMPCLMDAPGVADDQQVTAPVTHQHQMGSMADHGMGDDGQAPTDSDHGPCPDHHSRGHCASMPSCAAVVALPAVASSQAPDEGRVRAVFATPILQRGQDKTPDAPPPRV